MTITLETIETIAKIITAVTVIGGVVVLVLKEIKKYQNYDNRITKIDNEIKKLKEEQCMQTYVLEAVLDGLHQLGCNGKTTEASENLSKFVNKRAHDQEIT